MSCAHRLYLPNDAWPLGGKMSIGLSQLQIGDTLEVKGPLGSLILESHDSIIHKGVSQTIKEFGLVCGGSGERAPRSI